MSSEKYLQEVTVGEITVHNQKIELCEYDDNWPVLFQKEAAKIYNALGTTALKIEHVGSTSVPGLCAKPIIDILLCVEDSAKESEYGKQLERVGYLLRIREPKWFEHRMFKGKDPAVNLHVFSQNCEEAERMTAFRDWLCTHESDRNLYAQAKRQLAKQIWRYIQDYADAKTRVVQEIMGRITEQSDPV